MSEINRNYVISEGDEGFRAELKEALEHALAMLKKYSCKYKSGDLYQSKYKNGEYTPVINAQPTYWTESFYSGQLWLAYEETHDQELRDIADKHVLDFHRRVVLNDEIDWHHDLGFLYTLSSIAPYKLTGNEIGRKSALMAAYSLSRRFRFKGSFIQSMGDDGDYAPQNYRFIADTMMNLPLLFWAAEETGDMSYVDKAVRHIKTTMKYIVREDGTSYHHFLMDHATGGPIRGLTLQGAHDESFWSRGHSWMVYGLAIAYAYLGEDWLLDEFVRVTDAFVDHCPEDGVAFWDFIYNDGDDEPRDSSASAIALCGILEMARLIPHDMCKMDKYLKYAEKTIKSLIRNYRSTEETNEEGLLLHTTPYKGGGSYDTCSTYGDYFYLEMLVRALRSWEMYW